ncbi:hypothetical protein ABPG77_010472 [Micractinium sp. CCAP 211/92]
MELTSRLQLCLMIVAVVLAASSGISAAPAAKPPPKPLALSGYPTRAAAAAAARQLAGLSAAGKRDLYSFWCRKYKKQPDDRRYRAWLSNLNSTIAWNIRPHPPFIKGMNGLSDYTPAELSRMVMRRSDPSRARTHGGSVSVGGAIAAASAAGSAPLPDEWNWVTQGKVSEVRDQTLGGTSQCGACWAFAVLGALESRARIDRTDRGPNYSEQQMIDCVTEAAGYSSNGCDGGTAEDVFTFISASFVAQESGYPPYIARQGGRCRAASTVGAATVKRAPGYGFVPGNPEAIMRSIVQTGPVAYLFVLPPTNGASLFYYDPASGSYPASVCVSGNPSNEINHAVVIVGYNRAELYWIVRNSWGIGWGNGGYARLEMTDGGFGPCAMYKYGVLAPRQTAKYVPPPAPPPSSRLPPLGWNLVASDSAGRVLAAAGDDSYSVDSYTISRVFTSQDAARTWTGSINASYIDACAVCSEYWSSLSISGDGSLFLAGTDDEYLYTSGNGRNWTRRAASFRQIWWAATAASYDGMRLAAAADFFGTGIITSSDRGVTWTKQNATSGRDWSVLASSSDGMRLAAGESFGGNIYTSSDGRQADPVPKAWLSLASSGDGLRLLAAAANQTSPASSSGPCLYLSEDGGESWRKKQCLGNWGSLAISADGSRLFAGRDGAVFTSSDGLTWKPCGAVGKGFISSLAVSADGQRVFAASDAPALLLSTDACASWVSV